MWAWIDRQHRLLALAGLAVIVLMGLALHRDYGVPWDEPYQRGYGQLVTRYVINGNPALFRDPYRVYGPAHELLLLAAETAFRARDSVDVFATRHLVNFLVFVVGLIFLYRLGLAGGVGGAGSLLVCLALVLTPQFFAHAFYNSKDLPFLACFITAAYTLLRLLEKPRLSFALVHGLVTAWLIAIRITGVLIPAITVALAAYCLVRGSRSTRARLVTSVAIYLLTTVVLTWAFWPTLWRNPVASFANAFSTMSRYPWNNEVLYRGQLIQATDIPWHYALVWIAITTPLVYLAGFFPGLAATASRIFRQTGDPTSAVNLFPLLVLAWLFLPLCSVIALHSVMYDGWRHLFFIYPAILFVAVEGFKALLEIRMVSMVAAAILAVGLLDVGRFMVQAHPQQQVFFNGLVGGLQGARFRYDMDYWGLSYRSGLEAIARMDQGTAIPVYAADQPVGGSNAGTLPFADRSRLYFVDAPDDAKYALGTYRFRQEEYPYPRVVHTTRVDGASILSVAAVHPDVSLTPDTLPNVAAIRAHNEQVTAGLDESALRARLEAKARTFLSRYIRSADALQIDLAGSNIADLRQGLVKSARLSMRNGEVGDFRFNAAGVPFEALDVTVEDLIVDIERHDSSDLIPVKLGTLAVSDFAVDAAAVNKAMERRTDNMRNLRLQFGAGSIRANWSGKPTADLTLRLWVAADPWKPASDNLFFAIAGAHASGWPLPASLLQLVAGGYSPALDPNKITTRVVLGKLVIDTARLRIGTGVNDEASHVRNDLR